MENYETKYFHYKDIHDIDAWLGEFVKWVRRGYRTYEIVSYIAVSDSMVLITVKRWESQYQKDA